MSPALIAAIKFLELLIIVDLNNHQWYAISYNEIIKSGSAIGGINRCKENRHLSCKTPIGLYTILDISPLKYKRSDLYPITCKNKKKCGAKMYYFTKFHSSGIGIHGSDHPLRNINESHGCIRVSKPDAHWINKKVNLGTLVIILEY